MRNLCAKVRLQRINAQTKLSILGQRLWFWEKSNKWPDLRYWWRGQWRSRLLHLKRRTMVMCPSNSDFLVTLGHLMGIGGCLEVVLNVHELGTGVLVATLKRGHSRMSGRLAVRGLRWRRGRDWARRQGGWGRHRVLHWLMWSWATMLISFGSMSHDLCSNLG